MSTPTSDALAAALIDALDDRALDDLAERLAPRLEARFSRRVSVDADADGWLTTTEAAGYLGMTPNALHKLTAARAIPFAQDGPGCRCHFKRSDLDGWRDSGGRGEPRQSERFSTGGCVSSRRSPCSSQAPPIARKPVVDRKAAGDATGAAHLQGGRWGSADFPSPPNSLRQGGRSPHDALGRS